MALTLNTPGVYVEEVSLLPPSVAQVATAIPAFIGYTEKAVALDGTSLLPNATTPPSPPVPVRITSMLEYEAQFGKAHPQVDITVQVKGNTIKSDLAPVDRSPYLMYYSLQMYFANGGGPCYIVSVGNYEDTFDIPSLEKGLLSVEKENEPTLLLFPDITAFSPEDAYGLYNLALQQCNKTQDRFAIIDTIMDFSTPVTNPAGDFLNLRNYISNDPDYTKYGAAYYPYLKATIDYQYADADVYVSITTEGDPQSDVSAINSSSVTDSKTLLAGYLVDMTNYETNAGNAPDTPTALAEAQNAIVKIGEIVNVSTSLITSLNNIIAIADEVIATYPPADTGTISTLRGQIALWLTSNPIAMNANMNNNLLVLSGLNNTNTVSEISSAINVAVMSMGSPDIATALGTLQSSTISNLINDLTPFSLVTTTATLASIKISNNGLYNRIKTSISQIPVLLPPSSSIAGVYARIDAANGVWKAPANTSLNYVIGPNYAISNDTQDGMNIDTLAGKSINAIRAFTGRGTLVWGARTLNGNSNEWRYISVRRFYNMVEESVKNATEGFVFQANDANTWARVRAMIENYLILQWKAGALAGAKPEQAFYVKVGLGATMTADDVLNGRMIIEIGMAVVRPAEFIVLRFSHMMQQS